MVKLPKIGAFLHYRDETTGCDVSKYPDGMCMISGVVSYPITSENIGNGYDGELKQPIPNVLKKTRDSECIFCNNKYTFSNAIIYSPFVIDNQTKIQVYYHKLSTPFTVGDTVDFYFLIKGWWK